jgi:small subunit ribosomal protein S5
MAMAPVIEETSGVDTNTLGVFRTAATVKGGRRFSFGSMVVAGDRRGRVGLGYGKANEVPPAIEKAGKEAKKNLIHVQLQGATIPHEVVGRAGSSTVKLMPASPGTGVIAGSTVRAILELLGVTDCMTKAYGSTNKKNLAKAVINGLAQLRSKADVQGLRGVELGDTEVDERIARASAFMDQQAPKKPSAPKTDAPADDKPTDEKKAGDTKPDGTKTGDAPDEPKAEADAPAEKPADAPAEKPADG